MGSFSRLRPNGGWITDTPVPQDEWEQMDDMRPAVLNGSSGSTHAPSSPIEVLGAGMNLALGPTGISNYPLVQTFEAAGIWTPPLWGKALHIEMGGGGCGGRPGETGGPGIGGGGGGSGIFISFWIRLSDLFLDIGSTEITVDAIGAGGATATSASGKANSGGYTRIWARGTNYSDALFKAIASGGEARQTNEASNLGGTGYSGGGAGSVFSTPNEGGDGGFGGSSGENRGGEDGGTGAVPWPATFGALLGFTGLTGGTGGALDASGNGSGGGGGGGWGDVNQAGGTGNNGAGASPGNGGRGGRGYSAGGGGGGASVDEGGYGGSGAIGAVRFTTY